MGKGLGMESVGCGKQQAMEQISREIPKGIRERKLTTSLRMRQEQDRDK